MTPDSPAPVAATPSPSSAIQAALLALAAPFLLSIWNSILLPELKKLESQIGSPDLQLVASALEEALNKIAQAEIPKI